jgi:hypothetical protein
MKRPSGLEAHQAARRRRPRRASRLPDSSRTVRRPRWGVSGRIDAVPPAPALDARSTRGGRGRSSAGPPRPAARPRPPSSGARTLASALLLPSQFPLLAQSHLEEHQEHSCAKTDGDHRDGEHFSGQPADQDRADRTNDNERGGRSKRQDAQAGRHHPKVSLGPAAAGHHQHRDSPVRAPLSPSHFGGRQFAWTGDRWSPKL